MQGALALLDGLDKMDDLVSVLQTYDDSVVRATLSLSALDAQKQKDILKNLDTIKTQNLIHKNNIQDIVDAAKLDAIESQKLKASLQECAAKAAESKITDTLTRKELEEALTSAKVTVAKRQEILARYDNAAAANAEVSALSLYGVKIKSTMAAIKAFALANPLAAIGTGLAGAITAALGIGVYAYRKHLEKLEERAAESKEAFDEAASAVATLESELADVKQRLKEIDEIGELDVVAADEKKKLEELNAELERELRVQQALYDLRKLQAEKDALNNLNAQRYQDPGRSEHGSLQWSSAIDEYINQYEFWQKKINDINARLTWENLSNEEIASLKDQRDNYETLRDEMLADMEDIFNEIQTGVIDVIGNSALTAQGQAFLNEWQKRYDAWQDLVLEWAGDDPVDGVSGGGGGAEEDSNAGKDLNTKLASVIEKYKLLEALHNDIKNGGKISADSLSGIVEQFGDLDQSVADYHQGLITADELVRRVAAAYQGAVDGYRDLGGQLNIQQLLAETDEKQIETFSEGLEGIVEKFDFLKEAQKEFADNGTLTAATLSSIVANFPQLEESVMLYVAGLKSTEDLLAELSGAYRKDEKVWKETLKAKLYVSTEYCNSLTEDQSKLIDELAESYGVDLDNFRTIEEAKADIQAQIIQHLAENYARYANATLEDLKARLELLKVQQETIQAVDINGNTDHAHQRDVWLARKKEIAALLNAIRDIEGAYEGLDEILMEPWDPSKFVDPDDAEDAFEKFKAEWEDWFSDMEFKVNLKYEAGDLSAASELYKQMVDKAQELLNDAYSEGMTIDDDWVQDLITKVNTYKKALADLRIEEYDKLIEYNDQFDVWNHVSYTKLDKLKEKLEAINEQYITGLVSYQEWHDAFLDTAGDIYDIQRDAIEELLETQLKAIKAQTEAQIESIEEQRDASVEALEDQLDAMDKLIERRKKLLEDARDEAAYEREVAKRVQEIAKLQERISQLALDNSREATAERMSLETQLSELQAELTDYQNSYATDATIEALEEQQKLYEDSIDDKIDAVEDAADEELKILKAQLDDEVALRKQAIAQIDRDYQTMMQDIEGYFEALGITIDSELLDKLREGLSLVAQFGSYDGASSGISTNLGGVGGSSSIASLVQQMKENSAKWWEVKTPGSKGNEQNAEQQKLSRANERIAEMLKEMGLDIWKENGEWFIRINGTKASLFSYFGGVFHNGGVVGRATTPKSDELFALLKEGEVVLNDGQQERLLNIMEDARRWTNAAMSAVASLSARPGSGARSQTTTHTIGQFSPSVHIHFGDVGNMDEAKAKKLGQIAGQEALDKLWETLNKRGIT